MDEDNVIYVVFDYAHNRVIINGDTWGCNVLEDIIKLRKEGCIVVSKITNGKLIRIVKIKDKLFDIGNETEVANGTKIQ